MLPFFTLLLLIIMTIYLNIHSPSNLQHKLFIHYWNHFKREGLLFLSCFSGSPHLLGMGRKPFTPSLHRGHLCWDLSTLLASHFSFCKGLLLLSTSHFSVGYMEGHHCHPSKVIICIQLHTSSWFLSYGQKEKKTSGRGVVLANTSTDKKLFGFCNRGFYFP